MKLIPLELVLVGDDVKRIQCLVMKMNDSTLEPNWFLQNVNVVNRLITIT